MTRRKKILTRVAISIAALVLVVIVTSVMVLRTDRFQNYVRERIISTVEESTGGRAELRSFVFDWHSLTARATGFVVHGTEPPGSAPLFEASSIVVRLKLFPNRTKAIDLEYLGVDRPRANIMVFPDGRTNIPTPKVVRRNEKSGLETVVDLAIHKVDVADGSIQYLEQSIPLSARGQNLKIELMFDPAAARYQGEISMSPITVVSGRRTPLQAKLTIPLSLEKDKIQVSNAKIETPESSVILTGSLDHLADPRISGQLSAHVSLLEMTHSLTLPIHPQHGRAPEALDALIVIDSNQIRNASVSLGNTRVEASGDLKQGADFRANLSLDELGRLFEFERPTGPVQISGKVALTNAGKTIDVRGLKMLVFGGELTAEVQLEELSRWTVKGAVRGFDIHHLSAALASRSVGYAGAISGTLDARGNLVAPAASGWEAQLRLAIKPSGAGIPVSGQINADYNAGKNVVSLRNSQIKLPNTRIDLSGQPGDKAEIRITSQNLTDFQPVFAFASSNPMPVALRGGNGSLIAEITGPLQTPRISGHVGLTKFVINQRPFDQLDADFEAFSSGASIRNGSFSRNGSHAQFSASAGLHNWSAEPGERLTANATVDHGDLADILALVGESRIRASGVLNADVRIFGTIGNPQGAVNLDVLNGVAFDEPFDHLQAHVDLSDRLVTLKSAELTAGAARIDLRGSFEHPRDGFGTGKIQVHAASNQIQVGQFVTLQKQHPGLTGIVSVTGDISGNLRESKGQTEFILSAVNADVRGTGLRDRAQDYGNLVATATTSGSDVNTRVESNFAGSTIQITARTRLADGYPTTADATIRSLPIEKALALMPKETRIPAAGTLSAQAHLTGTTDNPNANLKFNLTKAMVYDEPIDAVEGAVDYTNQLVNISSLQLRSPAGRIELSGKFTHPASDFESGQVELRVTTQNIDLGRVQTVQKSKPGLAGTLKLTAAMAADLRRENGERVLLPSHLEANGGVNRIEMNTHAFGDVTFQAETKADVLAMKLDSDFAKSTVHGDVQMHLKDDYPANGKITFANVTYSGLQEFLGMETDGKPAVDGFVEGQVTLAGEAKRPKSFQGELQLSKLELFTMSKRGTPGSSSKTIILQNQGPIAAHLDPSTIRILSAKMTGPSTNVDVSGSVALDQGTPLDLTVKVDADLSLLKPFFQDVYSEGKVVVNSTVRGTLSQPLANGRVELKNASFESADLPNGISNANGVIQLSGTSATFRGLTAESGGGKVTVDGSLGFFGGTLNYNLRANGTRVRTRYAGASVVSSAALTLSGTSVRSSLTGTVTIEKVTYSQQNDFGAILSSAATPPRTPSSPEGLTAGMRLNIRIQTSPGVRFQTNLTQELEASADLHLRGTLDNPGIVGRIDITSGVIVFFGNKYTVNRGSISFYNSRSIEPILDLDLETSVKSVSVALGISGPVENLKLTYRSDPPLKFDDIVALLATGKTPRDATIAARQPATPDQSVTQMGASAILGQAVGNPVADRLQRVFGVSQLKIDPSFNSGSALPTARVTVQQQVTGSLTFTYTQDLTQTNSQVIRVEWEMSPRFSAVATRDENGIFGLDFFYKKQFR